MILCLSPCVCAEIHWNCCNGSLHVPLFSSSELSEDGTIRTAWFNSFSQIISASKSDFSVKQSKTKQKLNECLCPNHRISNKVFSHKKWSDKGIRQWDFKDISLKMSGIRGHGEKKKKGWSTLSPKLFLELLLPGLQKTQLKPIYSYDPSWGEDGGKRAVRFRDRTDKHSEQR